jgi:hypothetical protein
MWSSFSCRRVASLLLLGTLGTGCGFGAMNNDPLVKEGPEVSMKDVVSGTEVHVHMLVTDEDGDKITYKWGQSPPEPAGWYSNIAVPEPDWVAPDVAEPTSFQLQVNIRDSEGSWLVSWTTIQVHPRQ